MARYVLSCELSAQRLEEELPPAEPAPGGGDPLQMMAGAAAKFFSGGPIVHHLPGPPPGITMRKSFSLSVESFAELCKILESFDSLCDRVECEHP